MRVRDRARPSAYSPVSELLCKKMHNKLKWDVIWPLRRPINIGVGLKRAKTDVADMILFQRQGRSLIGVLCPPKHITWGLPSAHGERPTPCSYFPRYVVVVLDSATACWTNDLRGAARLAAAIAVGASDGGGGRQRLRLLSAMIMTLRAQDGIGD